LIHNQKEMVDSSKWLSQWGYLFKGMFGIIFCNAYSFDFLNKGQSVNMMTSRGS